MSTLIPKCFDFPIPKARQTVIAHPELLLISLLVIATKLYYPFTADKTAYATSDAELACMILDWNKWSTTQAAYDAEIKRIEQKRPFKPGAEILVEENDVFSMTEEQVDAYMDWFQRTWVNKNKRSLTQTSGQVEELLNMFPTSRHPSQVVDMTTTSAEIEEVIEMTNNNKLEVVQGSLIPRATGALDRHDGTKEKFEVIGSTFEHYRRENDIEGIAREFYEKVADMACINLGMLLKAVNKVERRLTLWKERNIKGKGKNKESEEIIY
jgi:RNA polymerase I-specific transcription initiation factor RRN7